MNFLGLWIILVLNEYTMATNSEYNTSQMLSIKTGETNRTISKIVCYGQSCSDGFWCSAKCCDPNPNLACCCESKLNFLYILIIKHIK